MYKIKTWLELKCGTFVKVRVEMMHTKLDFVRVKKQLLLVTTTGLRPFGYDEKLLYFLTLTKLRGFGQQNLTYTF